jgi:outer membrane protein OmpA-like peptidoglycan-associated protein
MAQFCPNCGTRADEGTRFCGKCGTNLGEAPAAAPTPSPAPSSPPAPPPVRTTTTAVAPTPPPAPPPKSGGGCGKVVVIVLIVVGLLIAAGIGGAAYLAYRAKKKIDQVKEAINTGNVNDVANAIGGGPSGKAVDAMPTYPDWTASSSTTLPVDATAPIATPAKGSAMAEKAMGQVLPMRKGLRIITAIQQSAGDYESIKEIRSVNEEGVLMDYSADNIPQPENPFMNEQEKAAAKKVKRSVHSSRKILSADLQSSHEYAESFGEMQPLSMPNTTALGISSSTLNDLLTKGESPFTYQEVGMKGALGGLLGGLAGMTDQMKKNNPNAGTPEDQKAQQAMKDLQNLGKVNCTLKRTDQKIYSFPVLLNDERVQLPAIRANCKSDDGKLAEFYFLNDSQNPLSLTWKVGKSDRLQVVKLEYTQQVSEKAQGGGKTSTSGGAGVDLETSGAAKQLEQKLEQQEKVRIYGIYFDFASAEIKPQSKDVLDEIAAVMNAHPDWKLSVAGHTDNIGGDAFNMQLSQQRADAVKQALVTQYKISPERLTTAGYGASSPVETNDTMEGRARNRRVELSKQ